MGCVVVCVVVVVVGGGTNAQYSCGGRLMQIVQAGGRPGLAGLTPSGGLRSAVPVRCHANPTGAGCQAQEGKRSAIPLHQAQRRAGAPLPAHRLASCRALCERLLGAAFWRTGCLLQGAACLMLGTGLVAMLRAHTPFGSGPLSPIAPTYPCFASCLQPGDQGHQVVSVDNTCS